MIDVELIGAPAFAVTVAGDVFTYEAINGRLADVIGVAPVDFIGQTPRSLMSPSYAEELLGHYRRCVRDRESVEFESFYDAPGGGRWWHTVVSPVLDGEEGNVVRLIGVAIDIASRKEAERRNREVEDRISLALELLDGGFWHYGIAGGRFSTSPELSVLLTGRVTSLDGPAYADLVIAEDRDALDLGALVRGEVDAVEAEYRVRTKAGALRWMSCRRRLTRDEAGRPENVVGLVVDITEQKLREAVLTAEAATDSLTGLQNRRGFDAVGHRLVARAAAEGKPFGLLMLDLDRFKPVNDTHGHAVGDAVLREVAARLRRHLRPGDVAVRLGGDEFAVLVGDATEDVLIGLSRRLIAALSRPVPTVAGRIEIGASVGGTLWRADDRDLAALNGRADAALLAVKRNGRGAWRMAA